MSAGNIPGPLLANSTAGPTPVNSTMAYRRHGPRNVMSRMRMTKVRRVSMDLVDDLYVNLDTSMGSWTESSKDTSTSTWSDESGDTRSSTISTGRWSDTSTDTQSITSLSQPSESVADVPQLPIDGPPPDLPTDVLPIPGDSAQTSDHIINGTPAPAQAPAKTQTAKASCTPSPSSNLAPTASKSSSSH